MVLEMAVLNVRPGSAEEFQRAFAAAAPILRGSSDYQRWKELLHHFYDPFPEVLHSALTPA
jgi:hypothetical protein